MQERLKELRHALGLTSEEFGRRIKVTRSSISNFEHGRRMMSSRTLFSICREFGVNENWLRYGTGDMFVHCPFDDVTEFSKTHRMGEMATSVLKAYLELTTSEQEYVEEFLQIVYDKIKSHQV